MVMQEIHENTQFEGGRQVRTEEELYEKAIALLEKCRISHQPEIQVTPGSTGEPATLQQTNSCQVELLSCAVLGKGRLFLKTALSRGPQGRVG